MLRMNMPRDSQRLGKVEPVNPAFVRHVRDPAISGLVFPQPILSDAVGAIATLDAEGGYAPLLARQRTRDSRSPRQRT